MYPISAVARENRPHFRPHCVDSAGGGPTRWGTPLRQRGQGRQQMTSMETACPPVRSLAHRQARPYAFRASLEHCRSLSRMVPKPDGDVSRLFRQRRLNRILTCRLRSVSDRVDCLEAELARV